MFVHLPHTLSADWLHLWRPLGTATLRLCASFWRPEQTKTPKPVYVISHVTLAESLVISCIVFLRDIALLIQFTFSSNMFTSLLGKERMDCSDFRCCQMPHRVCACSSGLRGQHGGQGWGSWLLVCRMYSIHIYLCRWSEPICDIHVFSLFTYGFYSGFLGYCFYCCARVHWNGIQLTRWSWALRPRGTQNGWTALVYAAYKGHADCVRELAQGRADKDAKSYVRAKNRIGWVLKLYEFGFVNIAIASIISFFLAHISVNNAWCVFRSATVGRGAYL